MIELLRSCRLNGTNNIHTKLNNPKVQFVFILLIKDGIVLCRFVCIVMLLRQTNDVDGFIKSYYTNIICCYLSQDGNEGKHLERQTFGIP